MIGRGGFGTVYNAVRNIDQASVAVKFIRNHTVSEWQPVRFHLLFLIKTDNIILINVSWTVKWYR